VHWFIYEDVDKREPIIGWNGEVKKIRKFIGYRVDDENAKLPTGNWVLRDDKFTSPWLEFWTYPFVKLGFYGPNLKERLEALWKDGVYTVWAAFDPLPEEKTLPAKKPPTTDAVSEAMKVFKEEKKPPEGGHA
jgi:hypothetical protein